MSSKKHKRNKSSRTHAHIYNIGYSLPIEIISGGGTLE